MAYNISLYWCHNHDGVSWWYCYRSIRCCWPGTEDSRLSGYLLQGLPEAIRLTIPMAAVGFGIDVYLLALPLGAVSTLQLPVRRRVGVCLVFLSGILSDDARSLLHSCGHQCVLIEHALDPYSVSSPGSTGSGLPT